LEGAVRQPITQRIRLFAGIALVAAVLALLTFVWHDWVEIIFGIEPDQGSGWIEAGITLVAIAVAIIAGLAASSELVRTRRRAHLGLDVAPDSRQD
jgi:hypothetical protein